MGAGFVEYVQRMTFARDAANEQPLLKKITFIDSSYGVEVSMNAGGLAIFASV